VSELPEIRRGNACHAVISTGLIPLGLRCVGLNDMACYHSNLLRISLTFFLLEVFHQTVSNRWIFTQEKEELRIYERDQKIRVYRTREWQIQRCWGGVVSGRVERKVKEATRDRCPIPDPRLHSSINANSKSVCHPDLVHRRK
jgi:hypothetical protein